MHEQPNDILHTRFEMRSQIAHHRLRFLCRLLNCEAFVAALDPGPDLWQFAICKR